MKTNFLNLNFILGFFILLSLNTHASKAELKDLDKVIKVYKEASTVILEVRKTIKSEILDKETIYKGMIRFSKGKFNWVNDEPEKSLLIYDGTVLWSIQYPPAEFKAPPQIAKTKLKKGKNSPLILTSVFGNKPLKNFFDIKTTDTEGVYQVFELKEKKENLGIKNVKLAIDTKEDRIISLQYLDEVENFTKLEFRSSQFNEKISPAMFSFKPPKGAAIQEY